MCIIEAINLLFFELIRLSIGTQESLLRRPSDKEWKALFDMANKQSLVGVCFAGVQRLAEDDRPQGMLYLTWMGLAAKIQQRNEVMNQRCVELQERLAKDGFKSCIVKGQNAASLYDDKLCRLRQSGDIDIWVDAKREDIIRMVQKIAPTTNVREHHLELELFDDTEVEVHFWPAVIRHFLKNRRLQNWFNTKREEAFANGEPTPEFHAIQMMAHMYHHLFDSGLGLRQVMDYFFVLQKLGEDRVNVSEAVKHIGMERFAGAMMYVLQEVMGLELDKMILPPNEEDGRFLLDEIVRGGNFGNFDDRKTRDSRHYFSSFYGSIFRNMRYLRFNPYDWFWSPLWRLYYFGWRKVNGYH